MMRTLPDYWWWNYRTKLSAIPPRAPLILRFIASSIAPLPMPGSAIRQAALMYSALVSVLLFDRVIFLPLYSSRVEASAETSQPMFHAFRALPRGISSTSECALPNHLSKEINELIVFSRSSWPSSRNVVLRANPPGASCSKYEKGASKSSIVSSLLRSAEMSLRIFFRYVRIWCAAGRAASWSRK